jgi:hypothetical protein
MDYRYGMLLVPLMLAACQPLHVPEPEVTRAEMAAQTVKVEALQQELEVVHGQVDTLSRQHDGLLRQDLPTRLALLEALQRPAKPPKGKPLRKAPQEMNSMQLVAYAQKEARIEPSEGNFFAKSGEMTYSWVPGKIFTILLAPTQQTGLFLPPGERVIVGLLLDKEEYEVHSERAGTDPLSYDAIFVRPKVDSGQVDAALVTESGRRYLLHFVVGKVGMLAVTFETPQLTQVRAPERPQLILPRPTP